jgi:putative spermidine/putrescine transport system ATP-binding protein
LILAASRGHALDLEAINHQFGEFTALSEINLAVGAGEMLALLGPSGCGKSTLLRIIAGFIRQTAGHVRFDGQPVDGLDPRRRGVGIVFQNYALFPHMTVRQNVAYGLQAHGRPKAEIAPRVDEMLDLVHMSAFAERLPRQLSGGQQQRIALARCLATDPKILLLDEPFGALDKNLRLDMQIEVKRLQRDYGITTVLVTHDQEEALSMADRIAVMNKGRIEQVATPTQVYDNPATLFVNSFVGNTNVLDGVVTSTSASGISVDLSGGIRLNGLAASGCNAGDKVQVSIRPEQLLISTDQAVLSGVIKTVLPLGAHVAYDVAMGNGAALKVMRSRGPGDQLLAAGQTIFLAPSSQQSFKTFRITN